MSRRFFPVAEIAENIAAGDASADLAGWLCTQTGSLGPSLLLAHADDGVIWGVVDPHACVTGHDAARQFPEAAEISPRLRSPTLQTARLFNERGEVLLWRVDDEWCARRIRPAEAGESATLNEAFDEDQLLWGDHGARLGDSRFVLLREGSQGLRHLAPLPEPPSARRRGRLRIRNYVAADETGALRIIGSRLVTLSLEEERRA